MLIASGSFVLFLGHVYTDDVGRALSQRIHRGVADVPVEMGGGLDLLEEPWHRVRLLEADCDPCFAFRVSLAVCGRGAEKSFVASEGCGLDPQS